MVESANFIAFTSCLFQTKRDINYGITTISGVISDCCLYPIYFHCWNIPLICHLKWWKIPPHHMLNFDKLIHHNFTGNGGNWNLGRSIEVFFLGQNGGVPNGVPDRGFPARHGGYPKFAGWFISGKIPPRNGWWTGVPYLWKPPIGSITLHRICPSYPVLKNFMPPWRLHVKNHLFSSYQGKQTQFFTT